MGGFPAPSPIALVEGQEPRGLAFELGANVNLAVVDGEVNDAAAKCEERLAWIAVAPVLLYRVRNGLFGKAVLELERGDRADR